MSEISEDADRPVVSGGLPALGRIGSGRRVRRYRDEPPLHLKTVLGVMGGAPEPSAVLGVLSLAFWTLIVITTIKYIAVAMSIDNDDEGGILALLSLLGVKRRHRPAIIVVGLFGAALIYGDGAITPAISVLSALEGLNIAVLALGPHLLSVAVLDVNCSQSVRCAVHRTHGAQSGAT